MGAGDSMLAAFIYAMINKMEVKEAFRLSVAAGSATAFSEGFVTRDEVYASWIGLLLRNVYSLNTA